MFYISCIYIPEGPCFTYHVYTYLEGPCFTYHVYTYLEGLCFTYHVYTYLEGLCFTYHVYTYLEGLCFKLDVFPSLPPSGGSVPVFDEIVISTSLMNKIISLDQTSGQNQCMHLMFYHSPVLLATVLAS